MVSAQLILSYLILFRNFKLKLLASFHDFHIFKIHNRTRKILHNNLKLFFYRIKKITRNALWACIMIRIQAQFGPIFPHKLCFRNSKGKVKQRAGLGYMEHLFPLKFAWKAHILYSMLFSLQLPFFTLTPHTRPGGK